MEKQAKAKERVFFLNRMKIANKLTLVYSALIVLILLVFTSFTMLALYTYGNYQSSRVLTIASSTIVNGISKKSDLFENNWDTITEGNGLYVIVYSEQGEILRNPGELSLDNDLLEDASLETFGKVFRRDFFDDAAYLNRSVMIGEEVFIIQLIKDNRTELRILTFISIILFSLLALGGVVSVFVGRKMSREALRPIGDMTENANNIQRGGVSSERLTLSNKRDEITSLGETINAMLDRIEDYSFTLTRFVSDASHELRTPIAVLLSHAEMLKKWAMNDREALERCVDSIEKEAISMKFLVERLLTLAKSDSKNLGAHCEPIDLHDFIKEIVEETTFIAGDRTIELTSNATLSISTDRELLKQLLRIIIDNAIKYTSNDGRIQISSTLEGGRLTISIRDNGIGIKAEELDKIFDRFYCCETSRNKKKSGSGLGLAIAKALSIELGFSLTADSKENEYTNFTLTKPLKN